MNINGVVERKLCLLEQKLADINDWKITGYDEFKKSSLKINAVERALTVCVEIMIDVSERILSIKNLPPKNSSVENFQELEKLNCIKSCKKYSEMLKFRNFVVHRYEYIDTEILYNIVSNKLCNFTDFVHEIRAYDK